MTDLALAFDRYDLERYDLFLRAKKLPESRIAYDWESDVYTITTPERYGRLLGLAPAAERTFHAAASHLFDYQDAISGDALDAQRFAIWADTGLGKTAMFLDWARRVVDATGGRVLILSPRQIIEQTRDEWAKFYPNADPVKRLDTREAMATWCTAAGEGIGITNYEKLVAGELPELRHLAGLVADESSILKTGGGTIKWNLIHSAKGIEFKLSCTATPAPNDTMEYASQAAFLEKLRSESEILWTYFSRDKHGNWRVKPHAQNAFYEFMSTWSIYLRDPAHYGWADILATLPDPVVHEHTLAMTPEQERLMWTLRTSTGSGLFGDQRVGVKERSKLSQLAKGFLYDKGEPERVPSTKPAFVAELVRQEVDAGRQVIVWTVFDEESAIVYEALASAGVHPIRALHGSTPDDTRETVIAEFKDGRAQVLISKPQLLGYGLNFQNCRAMVFSGFDDSFERMYQAIRRAYRFGQTEPVHVHFPVIAELEGLMFENVRQKEERFARETAIQEANYIKARGQRAA